MKLNVKMLLAALAVLLAAGVMRPAPVQAAKKKTVYVITGEYSDKVVKKNLYKRYTYNNNGLLKGFSMGGGAVRGEYKYDKKNRLTRYRQSLNEWTTFDYSYNKKDQISAIKGYYTNMSNNKFAYDGLKTKYTYNKKGQVIKEFTTGEAYDWEKEKTVNAKYTITYSYNKKGLLSKRKEVIKLSKTVKGTMSFKYDKKGNVTEYKDPNGTTKWKYTYDKNGNVTKKTAYYYDDSEGVTAYKYKAVKVDAALAEKIKAQQWSLINHRWNFAIPVNNYNAG